MKIDRVEIKNFKALKHIDIELGNLTLLTGKNSAGKSSFIQALLLLKQNQFNLEQLLFYKESQERKKLFFDFDGKYTQLLGFNYILFQDPDLNKILVNLYSTTSSLEIFLEEKSTGLSLSKGKPLQFNLFNSNTQYIMTNRITPKMGYPLSSTIDNNLIGHEGEYTAHYLFENKNKKLNIEKLKHINAITNQLLENTSLWLGEISSGIDISTKINLNQVNLIYQYIYGKKRTNEYTPLNIGFGITYVLPVIVSILKSEPGDLVIIENPESHLHPAGQSKIAELCSIAAEAGVQIIIETHSDHFLNGLRVATKNGQIKPESSKIYYFRKDHDKLETEINELSIDSQGSINEDWPDGFFDEYRKRLDELLW